MFLAEPPSSPYDVHFRLFGFPVRVSPWFWLVTLFLTLGGSARVEPVEALVWMIVVFVSILVHELGHAFVQRHYGGHPRITLYGFGGLASCGDCDRSPRSQILISLAGPAAGFLLAICLAIAIRMSGKQVQFGVGPGLLGAIMPSWEPLESWLLQLTIFYLFYVNILWGIVNLLPIYPLDGGQISRELFSLNRPYRGIVESLWLSVIAAAAMAVLGLISNRFFTATMFALLAYSSYQALQGDRQR